VPPSFRRPWLHVALAALVAACAEESAPPRAPSLAPDPSVMTDLPAPDDPAARSPLDVQKVAAYVARLRHLDLRAPVKMEELPLADFLARFRAGSLTGRAPRSDDTSAFWVGFGFVDPNAQRDVGAILGRVLDEQVAGFYSPGEKTLYLRREEGTARRSASARNTLVHEVEHALQDQAFGMSDDASLSEDARLAHLAVYEGDAMLTMAAYEAATSTDVVEHWVSRLAHHVRSMSLERIVGMGEHSKELLSAPPLVQRRVLFPYLHGLVFVADLYRAGGLGIVDRAFHNLPASTEQVLHPEKYLAGEPPVPVATPPAPPGHRAVASGAMGELQTSVFLAQCAPTEEARAAAEGWGGDAYAIVLDPHGRLSILWSTAWDDESAAARFEAAARRRASCANVRADAAVGKNLVVLRDGARVAVVQGLDGVLADSEARALHHLVGAAPAASPPLGRISVPPLVVPEEAFLNRGRLERRAYVSAPLGMRIAVPPQFGATLTQKAIELTVDRPGPHPAFGAFAFAMASDTPRVERAFLHGILKGLREKTEFASYEFRYKGLFRTDVGGAPAATHMWRFGPQGQVAVAFAPACGGKGTAIFTMLWGTDDAFAQLGAWLDGVRLPAADAPVCRWLASD
jgi:hypothetical protein